MKTLIILAHPNITNSLVNRRWRDAVLAHPDKFELHDLYALYLEMLALGALVAFYRGLPLLYKYSYSIAEARASKILTKPPRRGNFNKI